MSKMSERHPTFALEPVCDACHCSQADHASEEQRIEEMMHECPPAHDGAAISLCSECNDCYVEPTEFRDHAGIAAYHPQIEQEMFRLRRQESAIRRINGAAHIAQQILGTLPQAGRLVLHGGDDTHPAFVSIHVPVLGYTLKEGERISFETRAIYEELERRGFDHARSHDFVNLQNGSSQTRYRHPITGYELEIVLYGESDPDAHPPFTAAQVNEIRANFWQQLSGTGASS
jgi:hypothetical protein